MDLGLLKVTGFRLHFSRRKHCQLLDLLLLRDYFSRILLGLIVIIFFACSDSYAQDTHHWNNQFGTRAALLGGAVLTDTIDNAGVYYNPGNLAFLDTTTLSINANLYGLENIKIENIKI